MVSFDFGFLDEMVQEIIESGMLYDKNITSGIWIENDEGMPYNIILDFKENKWKLRHFTFIDMMAIEKGINILFLFSNEDNTSAVSYQKTYSCVSEMLINNSAHKKFLTTVKVNKDKINFEELDQEDLGFELGEV